MSREVLSGYVIHKRAYRETSMIVDFFSAQNGKVSAVAKGIKASKSDRKSLLQPLQALSFELSGKSSLKTLISVESTQRSFVLSANALYSAFYINELLSRSLKESDKSTILYAQYELSLNKLSSLQAPNNADDDKAQQSYSFALQIILREFEFVLLQQLGYLPDFEYDVADGSAILANQYYSLSDEQGFAQCEPERGLAIAGETLFRIARSEWDIDSLKAAKQIVRRVLPSIIGDKPIKSRELFIAK